jgi:hypothetical protein
MKQLGKPSYVIKERKEVTYTRVKQNCRHICVGGGLGISKDITPSFTGNVGFQNERRYYIEVMR